ncbi:hypothetical protein [Dehalococcoides mccartyi]|uniref:Uncharacterized protein n=1 Tax=Dehalococcoides mccartyi TaxID=61435 RepID=A0AB33HMW8_9CHLR|nr:hypothetical protein [Dehalococcoides mccartyi]BAS31179.1 hypothetical protein IBK_0104 [Dehalococcoides mccartyi IBARAKI]BAZ96708.1 hypothetical protein DEHALATV1_0080 [Dehalococcoides mccartyi]
MNKSVQTASNPKSIVLGKVDKFTAKEIVDAGGGPSFLDVKAIASVTLQDVGMLSTLNPECVYIESISLVMEGINPAKNQTIIFTGPENLEIKSNGIQGLISPKLSISFTCDVPAQYDGAKIASSTKGAAGLILNFELVSKVSDK